MAREVRTRIRNGKATTRVTDNRDRSKRGKGGKFKGSRKRSDVALVVLFVLAMLAQAPTLATAVVFAAPVVVVARAVWPVARHVPAGYRWLTKW